MRPLAEALALARQHHQAGALQEAEALFQDILQAQPANPAALQGLGTIACQTGRFALAIDCLRAARAQLPDNPAVQRMLGLAHAHLGQPAEAAACFQEAVRLRPDVPETHHDLGTALNLQGRFDDAIACFQEALRLRPSYAEARTGLGDALKSAGRFEEAIACYRDALRIRPDSFHALNNLGNAYERLGLLDDALACLAQALRVQPDRAETHNNLGMAFKNQGRVAEAMASFRRSLQLRPNAETHSNLLLCMNYDALTDPQALFAEHRRWGEIHGGAAQVGQRLWPNARRTDRRLRIGYVSPDFRKHPVARFLEPILAQHDPERVAAFCYAEVPAPDAVTARFQSLAHAWRPTRGLTHAQVADLIRADGIDILVDVAGHTANPQLLCFAHKPAPIQITYLGYPNTTGLATIDNRLTDALADPPDEPVLHTEALVRLPGCFCCFAPPDCAPEVSALPARSTGHITFGSLHHLAKLNGAVLDLWAGILQAVPTSRLLIFRNTLRGSVSARLEQEFAARGIDRQRVDLRHEMPAGRDYLELHGDIDIHLDAVPWSAHTTACESLWMGVPVLTLRGDRHAGRMAASVLSSVGLPEWIAETSDQYVALATQFAEQPDRLAELRSGLRERMRNSPLCDARTFTRNLEQVYAELWHEWCKA